MRHLSVLLLIMSSLLLSVGGLGCKDKPATANKTTTNATASTAPASPAAAVSSVPPAYPSISLEEMKVLFDKCDYIDFIFYNMDFSMSVNDKGNVQRVITFIDKAQPPGDVTCPAMGRIVFQSNGEILSEADMHYDKECFHFVIYKDGKKAYTNKMTAQGRTYFQQMFAQVRVVPNQ